MCNPEILTHLRPFLSHKFSCVVSLQCKESRTTSILSVSFPHLGSPLGHVLSSEWQDPGISRVVINKNKKVFIIPSAVRVRHGATNVSTDTFKGPRRLGEWESGDYLVLCAFQAINTVNISLADTIRVTNSNTSYK